MIYTVTFNPAIDYVVQLPCALGLGAVNRTRTESYQFGGKGINVSAVLAELGCPSVALGFVAGQTGVWLEKGLAGQGIATDFIRLPGGMTRINVKINDTVQETEINGRGPAIDETALDALTAKLAALCAGDTLVLAGSAPASLPQDCYRRLLAALEGKGVLAAVDATGELLLDTLAYKPFVIKPNHHELGGLFGRTLQTDEEITVCAKLLQKKGARNVLVSRAEKGALLVDEDGNVHRITAPQRRVVNSVGSGDSMLAGFLAGWQTSRSYDAALRLAVAAGSATAFSLGLAKRSQIETLLDTLP